MSTRVSTSVSIRFLSTADEPESTNRLIMFTVFDDDFSGNDSIVLSISTIDDNPTIVSPYAAVYMRDCVSCVK